MVWFNGEEFSGRKGARRNKRKSRGISILRVDAKQSTRRKTRMYQAGLMVFVPIVVLSAVGASWVGLHTARERLFTVNTRFSISKIDIIPGAVMTEALIRNCAQIEEGMNLFAVDIRDIQDKLLKSPNAKSIRVSRVLPGTLKIEVMERVPLGRLGASSLTVDRDGVIFNSGPRARRVATIMGYNGSLELKRKVHGSAWAAIELLEECDNPELGIQVQSVDVAEIDGMRMRIVYEGIPRLVDVAWEEMGQRTEASRGSLQSKLDQVMTVLQPKNGQTHTHIDATYEDQVVVVD